jgi:transposase
MKVKAPTLLRHLRTIPDPPDAPVHVLGIDDFSMRRGDCYGTILINMETHRPLDLLPDRTADAVLPWLQSHPEIDIVNRDRASAYADAVNRALPHATQVADRYHLVQNLREHVQKFLDHKHSLLPFVEDTPLKGDPTPSPSTGSPVACALTLEAPPFVPDQHSSTIQQDPARGQGQMEVELSSLTYAEQQKKISRDKRYARYEEVMALYRAGKAQRAIARELGVSRKLVAHFVSSPAFPERASRSGQRPSGKSKLTRFIPYLRERWLAGAHKSSQLYREIKEQGYTGSSSLLRHLIAQWRADLPPKPGQRNPQKPRMAISRGRRRLSSRKASFLMILPSEKLTDSERKYLEQMCQASPELCSTYLLSQEFVTMLKNREASSLDGWLTRAKESHVSQLNSFVNGISRDYAAVRAAFSLSWSNGTTEGHVNRLKFLKRQMFGRAHLDLLRVKVLHAV